MNRKIEDYFSSYDFDLQEDSGVGIIQGYEVNFQIDPFHDEMPLILHFSAYLEASLKPRIQEELLAKKIPYARFAFTNFGIQLGLNDLTLGKLAERLDQVITSVIGVLSAGGVPGYHFCPSCGKAFPSNKSAVRRQIDWCQIAIDDECVEKLNNVIHQSNLEFEKAPNHYFRGFLGAFLGAVIGDVAMIFLLNFGYFSAVSAFLGVWLGGVLYKKFGGKMNRTMILIDCMTTAVLLIVTMGVYYVLVAMALAPNYNIETTSVNGLSVFFQMMQMEAFANEFWINMGLTVLFIALGIGWEIFALVRSIRRQSAIK